MRTVTIFTPEETKQFTEKENCDIIMDARGEYPVVKIYIGEKIHIFKGMPYTLVVDKLGDREESGGGRPQPRFA